MHRVSVPALCASVFLLAGSSSFADPLTLQPEPYAAPRQQAGVQVAYAPPAQEAELERARPPVDPKFNRQSVMYSGPEKPGTVVIDTNQRFLFLVQEGGRATRYGIGVGRDGFTWR